MMPNKPALLSSPMWMDAPPSEDQVAHVLAVDDSLVDRTIIQKLLKMFSCKVTAVDSVMRALEFLGIDNDHQKSQDEEKQKIDLIITDYCMPEMTGYDLLKKIKESSAFKEVPVVIMSSENILTRVRKCLEEGAEDFIVKPVKLSDVERLREHLMVKSKAESTVAAPSDGPCQAASPTAPESPPYTASPPTSPGLTTSPPSPSRFSEPAPGPPPSDTPSTMPITSDP